MAGHKKKKLQQAMAESAESMETPKPKSSTKVAPSGDTITTTPLVRSSLTNLAYERALKAVDRGRAKCKYTVEQLRKEFLDYVDYFSGGMVTYTKKHKHVEYAGETSGNGSSDHLEETEKVYGSVFDNPDIIAYEQGTLNRAAVNEYMDDMVRQMLADGLTYYDCGYNEKTLQMEFVVPEGTADGTRELLEALISEGFYEGLGTSDLLVQAKEKNN